MDASEERREPRLGDAAASAEFNVNYSSDGFDVRLPAAQVWLPKKQDGRKLQPSRLEKTTSASITNQVIFLSFKGIDR